MKKNQFFKKVFQWMSSPDGWMLMEPSFYKKEKAAYPDSPGEVVLKMNNLMSKHHYYKDPNLTIEKLCTLTDVNRVYLSRSIQRVYGMNYCSWVNLFRVEEAKRVMREEMGSIVELQDLVFECGFNSMRSLSRAFSAREQCTPRQYYKRIRS